MSEIFISYSRVDKHLASKLANKLVMKGWTVFWDNQIPIGKTWDDILEEKLANASCVIVLWSPESVKSDWVRAEANEAANRNILIPVLISKTRIPLRFQLIQTADLTSWDGKKAHEGFNRLLEAVRCITPSPEMSGGHGETCTDAKSPTANIEDSQTPTIIQAGVIKKWLLTVRLAHSCVKSIPHPSLSHEDSMSQKDLDKIYNVIEVALINQRKAIALFEQAIRRDIELEEFLVEYPRLLSWLASDFQSDLKPFADYCDKLNEHARSLTKLQDRLRMLDHLDPLRLLKADL